MKFILNFFIDFFTSFIFFRKLITYTYKRSQGFQYNSYSLKDEVALALYFGNLVKTKKKVSGQIIIDAGANKGDYSKYLLETKLVFEKLIIIEPQSAHATSLDQLVEKNKNVFFEKVAIGAKPGKVTLFSDQKGSGLASLYQRDLDHFDIKVMSQQEEVKVTTLDAIALKYDLKHIDFLKLDLEGHEFEALRGAKKCLDSKLINSLIFEFGGCNIDSRTYFKDFWNLLVKEYGFSFYRLLPKRRLQHLSRYSEVYEQFLWQNVLACAPGIKPTWKILS
jgi:FkbM family methyltransferase